MTIQHVVASSAVGQKHDLADVAVDLNGAEYDPEAFNGLISCLKRPAATSMLFQTGNIICTGPDSPDAPHEGLGLIFERLESLPSALMRRLT